MIKVGTIVAEIQDIVRVKMVSSVRKHMITGDEYDGDRSYLDGFIDGCMDAG